MEKYKTKVLVNGHELKFWNPIQEFLSRTEAFEFRQDLWLGHDLHDVRKSHDLLDWADLIISEWTLGNAVWYSKHKKPHQRHITRFHLQERETRFPAKLEIDNVDMIVFVGKYIQEEAVEKFHLPLSKTCVIGNLVDLKKYALPKSVGSEFNIGVVGTVPKRKRLDLAFDLLEDLLEKDSRYTLHVKGPRPDSFDWLWARTAEREYYELLWNRIRKSPHGNRVIFSPGGDNVAEWFQNIGFILSSSDFESFHMAVAEGMCSGTIPIIWDWKGAEDIYRLVKPVAGLGEARDLVLQSHNSSMGLTMAQQSSNYVRVNFDAEVICDEWVRLLQTPKEQEIVPVPTAFGHRKVVVVWTISDWDSFHRKEMLEALAENLEPNGVEFLIIEPGDNLKHLLQRGQETEHSLSEYQENRPLRVGKNIHKARIVTHQVRKKLGQALHLAAVEHSGSGQRLELLVESYYGDNASIIHWIFKPNQVDRLAHGADDQFIYEIYDDYTFDFGSGEVIGDMRALEETICAKAQHVFFTADILADRKKQHCRAYSTVSNGVNFPIFQKYVARNTGEHASDACKSAGYLGNLSDFFDWELMVEVTRSLPDVEFYFHGGIELNKLDAKMGCVENLKAQPNTTFTGRLTREQGAAAIARYDVLLIPFIQNEAMDAVNPLKLWEYFAVGKPVVSSRMKAIEGLADDVFFAESALGWVTVIQDILAADDPGNRSDRLQSLAEKMSWSKLTEHHASKVLQIFD